MRKIAKLITIISVFVIGIIFAASCQKAQPNVQSEPSTNISHHKGQTISGELSPGEIHNAIVLAYKAQYGWDSARFDSVVYRTIVLMNNIYGTTLNPASESEKYVNMMDSLGLLGIDGKLLPLNDFLNKSISLETDPNTAAVLRNIKNTNLSDNAFISYVNQQIGTLSYLTGPDSAAIAGYKDVLLHSYSIRHNYGDGATIDATKKQISDADAEGYRIGFLIFYFRTFDLTQANLGGIELGLSCSVKCANGQ